MNEKLNIIYSYLSSQNIENLPDTYEGFAELMNDDAKAQKVHQFLLSKNIENVDQDFNGFKDYVGLKKKELSFLDVITTASGKEPLPFLGQSKASVNQPQPSPLTDKGSYAGDILERIGAGAIDLASSSPKQLRFAKRLLDIPKDLVKKELAMLGLSDETAEKVSGFIPYLKPRVIGDAINISSEIWNKIEKTNEFQDVEKKANELRESSARYDKTIQEFLKKKEYNKAIGSAFLSAAESFPMTLTAMFGGGVGLAAMGSYSAGAQYDQLSAVPDMKEAQKITNAVINGGLEIATERLGSANYGKLIKSLYKTAGKEVAEEAVKKATKGWFVNLFKKIGLYTAPIGEGLEEAVNQLGGNITARITGEDEDRPIDFGVVDSFAGGFAGGTTFIGMGLPAQLRQQKYEEKLKEKEKLAKEEGKGKETTDKGGVVTEVGELKVPEEVKGQKETELKLGDKEFGSKEEMFKYLDETSTNELGGVNRSALPNVGEYPSMATIRAIQEWTTKSNAVERENRQKLEQEQLKKEEETKDAERSRTENQKVIEQGTPGLVGQETDVSGVRHDAETGTIEKEVEQPFGAIEISPSKSDIVLTEENEADFEYELMQAFGRRLGVGRYDYIRKDDVIIRVKGHTPDWSNFNEDVLENGARGIINITVGDFNNTDARRLKTTREQFEEKNPNIPIIDITVGRGESLNDVLNEVKRQTKTSEQQEQEVKPVQKPEEFTEREQPAKVEQKVITGIKDLEQKASYDCGICALRTVLDKYGIETTEEKLIEETKPTEKEGVQLSAIVENAKSRGLDAEMKQGMTPDEIRKEIDNDTPVIILQNGVGETEAGKSYEGNEDGHYITIKGYDKDGFLFEDPSAEGKNLKISEADLLKRWHGYLDDGKTVAEGIGIVIKPQEGQKEAISAPITPEGTQTPPPPKEPLKSQENAPQEQKPLGAQERVLNQYETDQQQIVSDIVEENKEFYNVLHGAEAMENARNFIKERGIDGATRELEKPIPNSNEAPTRTVARLMLLDHYSRILGDEGKTQAEKDNAYNVVNKIQEMVSKEANKWGQANAHLNLWKTMQPSGQLEFVKRKIAEFNDKQLNKKVKGTDKTAGQLLDLMYNTLTEENKKVIDDILEGKNIAELIKKEPTKTKEAPPRKSVPREKIAQEQNYRKTLLDDYRKKNKGITLMAGVPLTSEQIELGGNLVASYVREGYYRLADIVERLKKDFESIGVTADDDQINGILNQPKKDGGTYRDYVTKQTEEVGLKEGMKSQRLRIQDVVKKHWSERDELGRSLADKLVDDAWLSPEEAKKISDAILKEYNKKIIERLASNKDLAKLLGTQKIPTEGKKKTYLSKFLEMTNLRPLQKDVYRELFAEKFGLTPEITAEQGKEIIRRAGVVQQVSGKGWFLRDATIDLAKYVYELQPKNRRAEFAETWIALSYAHMLSGIPTSILNLWSSGSNILSKPIRDFTNLSKYAKALKDKKTGKPISGSVYNPIGQMFWIALADGVQKGVVDATEAYVNGDVGSKYVEEISQQGQFKVGQLERNKYGKAKRFQPIVIKVKGKDVNLGNPLNLEKYVARNLAAQDRLMFDTAFELELIDIIRNNQALRGLSGKELLKKTLDIYKGRFVNEQEIAKELNEEALKYKELTGKSITQRQANIRYRELMLRELIDEGYITEDQKREAEALARSNVFTDDRNGMIATVANYIGRLANSKPMAGLIIKPFVPFTKIVGNVTEYMLDYTPVYGFLRANGKSISAIKKYANPEAQTAQMGEKGSRAYYEQMSRAWFGTIAFGTLVAMALGNDDEDWLEISGGYEQEAMKGKTGRENIMPPYTIRMGKFKISYLNIPALAVPLALIGNINDGLRKGLPEEEMMDRLTVALLATSALKTVTMVRDMSFVQGVKSFLEMTGDIMAMDEKQIENFGKIMLKNYVGFGLRPLPWNHAIVQQTWKFFDPVSYSQKDIKGILAYSAGIQHFISQPSIDQLGDDVKTYPGEKLMPYTHWMNIKGKDPRWRFLVDNNAIPTKISNSATMVESADGVAQRPLEAEEYHDYTQKAGKIFSDKLEKYMADKETLDQRAKDRTTTTNSKGEEVITTGIQDDVLELYNLSKEEARNQLFRWYDFKKSNLTGFNKLVKADALPTPETNPVIKLGTEEIKLTKEQLHDLNKKAIKNYYEMIVDYLEEEPSRTEKNEATGEFIYDEVLKALWSKARQGAKGQFIEENEELLIEKE